MSEQVRAALAAIVEGRDARRSTRRASRWARSWTARRRPAQLAALLVALRMRGETVEELAGFASAMRERVLRVEAPEGTIDVVGTGGDGSGTFNISTASALVVASTGVPVAKHGNRAITSRSGSADVLDALGVRIDHDADSAAASAARARVRVPVRARLPPGDEARRPDAPRDRRFGRRSTSSGRSRIPRERRRALIGVGDPAAAGADRRGRGAARDRADDGRPRRGRRRAAARRHGRGPRRRRRATSTFDGRHRRRSGLEPRADIRARRRHGRRERRDHRVDLRRRDGSAARRRAAERRGGAGRRRRRRRTSPTASPRPANALDAGHAARPAGAAAGRASRPPRRRPPRPASARRDGRDPRDDRHDAAPDRERQRPERQRAARRSGARPPRRRRRDRRSAPGRPSAGARRPRRRASSGAGSRRAGARGRSRSGSPRRACTSSPRSSAARRRPGAIAGRRRGHRRPRPRLPGRRRGGDLGAVRAALVRRVGRGPGARPPLGQRAGPREGVRRRSRASSTCCAPPAPMRCCCSRCCTRGGALARLVDDALDLGLEPLVEAHDERELEAALATRARVIGINNRDLRTLDVDPERAVAAARARPRGPARRSPSPASATRRRSAAGGPLGFDAALVGETLVRAGDPEAAARAFVAAGAPPDDPVEAARAPFVKICGITDEAGIRAALAAGADAIGLNLVPGTPRALSLEEAAHSPRVARAIAPADRRPADRRDHRRPVGGGPQRDRRGARCRRDPAPRRRGARSSSRKLDRPAWKTIHLPPAPTTRPPASNRLCRDGHRRRTERRAISRAAADLVTRARAFLEAGAARILLDTSGGPHPGGTGRRADPALVAAIAREVPVVLAGGLEPATVGDALRDIGGGRRRRRLRRRGAARRRASARARTR